MINLWRRWRERRRVRDDVDQRIANLERLILRKEEQLVAARQAQETTAIQQDAFEQSRDRIARAVASDECSWANVEGDPVDSPRTWPEPAGLIADENCRPVKINWPKITDSREVAKIVRDARQRIAEEHAVRFDLTPNDLQYLMEIEQAFRKEGSHEFVS